MSNTKLQDLLTPALVVGRRSTSLSGTGAKDTGPLPLYHINRLQATAIRECYRVLRQYGRMVSRIGNHQYDRVRQIYCLSIYWPRSRTAATTEDDGSSNPLFLFETIDDLIASPAIMQRFLADH